MFLEDGGEIDGAFEILGGVMKVFRSCRDPFLALGSPVWRAEIQLAAQKSERTGWQMVSWGSPHISISGYRGLNYLQQRLNSASSPEKKTRLCLRAG